MAGFLPLAIFCGACQGTQPTAMGTPAATSTPGETPKSQGRQQAPPAQAATQSEGQTTEKPEQQQKRVKFPPLFDGYGKVCDAYTLEVDLPYNETVSQGLVGEAVAAFDVFSPVITEPKQPFEIQVGVLAEQAQASVKKTSVLVRCADATTCEGLAGVLTFERPVFALRCINKESPGQEPPFARTWSRESLAVAREIHSAPTDCARIHHCGFVMFGRAALSCSSFAEAESRKCAAKTSCGEVVECLQEFEDPNVPKTHPLYEP